MGHCSVGPRSMGQSGEHHRQRGLQPEHARGSHVEGGVLAFGSVRGVVGGHGVDRARHAGGPKGADVGLTSQRGIHLVHRVIAGELGMGQRQMVGCHLGRDRQAFGLGSGHKLGGPSGGDVEEVHPPTGEPRQGDVARHHHLLGLGRDPRHPEPTRPLPLVHVAATGHVVVFTVLCQRDVEAPGVLEGSPHDSHVLDTGTVVGEEVDAQRRELAHGSQALSGAAHGDGTGHRHEAGGTGSQGEHLERDRGTVDGRIGVGHGDHSREPAQRGRPRSGLHRLGLLGAGLAEVGVEVHEPRSDNAATRVEHRRAARHGRPRGDLDHLGAVHHHIGDPFAPTVHDRAPADDDAARWARSGARTPARGFRHRRRSRGWEPDRKWAPAPGPRRPTPPAPGRGA